MKLKSLNIGRLTTNNNIVLAPMAGYTDDAFRSLAVKLGAGFCVTEMVSAKGLAYKNENTRELLKLADNENATAVQLFGREPDFLRRACESVDLAPFEIVDINMGCPVTKIYSNGEGSRLMEEPELAQKIVSECVKSGKTITVKFRAGVYENELLAVDFAKRMEDAGASLITIHGRTREGMYSGPVHYDQIAKAKEVVKIPVIANGGIFSVEDARLMIERTGADGVALATVISQYASAIAVVIILSVRREAVYALCLSKLTISKPILLKMLRFGVPNGIQNSMFSISNVLLTSAVNTLDTYALSAKTIAMNVTTILHNVAAAYTNAALTFSAQNYGAKNPRRIKRSVLVGLLQAFILTMGSSILCFSFIEPISDFYISSADTGRDFIIAYVRDVCIATLPLYFIASIMNVLSGTLRGVGYSLSPMFISVFGICGFRIVWIYTAINTPVFHTLWGLYLSYPISWSIVILGLLGILFTAWKKMKKNFRV